MQFISGDGAGFLACLFGDTDIGEPAPTHDIENLTADHATLDTRPLVNRNKLNYDRQTCYQCARQKARIYIL
jgi:hypothetical protein